MRLWRRIIMMLLPGRYIAPVSITSCHEKSKRTTNRLSSRRTIVSFLRAIVHESVGDISPKACWAYAQLPECASGRLEAHLTGGPPARSLAVLMPQTGHCYQRHTGSFWLQGLIVILSLPSRPLRSFRLMWAWPRGNSTGELSSGNFEKGHDPCG